MSRPDRSPSSPRAPMVSLDTVWFQVAGTICNLRCSHCFISCSPDNHNHEMMGLVEIRRHLRETVRLGVREYYFTGGEPFMNREIMSIIEATLRCGPVAVLTNGLFLDAGRCRNLRVIADESEYSLDIRISLDGWGAEDHDRIRGPGAFERTVAGIRRLAGAGINPVITVTEAAEGVGSGDGPARFLRSMQRFGLTRPRLKILPMWRIGEEETRQRGYEGWERLSTEQVTADGLEKLQCTSGRMITSRGVYVCPLLIEEPAARMGSALTEALGEFPLAYGACHTCYVSGVTCRT